MDFNTCREKLGLSDVNEIGWFFEGVGVLLYRKLVDIAVVDDPFSSPVEISWEKIKPVAEGERKQFGGSRIWEWSEYLYVGLGTVFGLDKCTIIFIKTQYSGFMRSADLEKRSSSVSMSLSLTHLQHKRRGGTRYKYQ